MRLSDHLDTDSGDRLTCGCGCGMGTRLEHWRPELLTLFEAIRNGAGVSVAVLSAWRCPRHNSRVGGSPRSQHSIGAALDLRLPPGWSFDDWAAHCEKVTRAVMRGQGGVGRYPGQRFVHVDLGLGVPAGRRWEG